MIIHEEEGDAFLLHVESGRYYGLNRSALVVWNAVVAGADPVDALTQKWPQRQPETLRSDAEALVTGLLNAGLITEQTEAPGPAA